MLGLLTKQMQIMAPGAIEGSPELQIPDHHSVQSNTLKLECERIQNPQAKGH